MRHCIYVCVNEADAEVTREVCAGMEEEGIPYEILEQSETLPVLLKNATAKSVFEFGIAIHKRTAILSHKKTFQPIQEIKNGNTANYRTLGINAARAVKKQPFQS